MPSVHEPAPAPAGRLDRAPIASGWRMPCFLRRPAAVVFFLLFAPLAAAGSTSPPTDGIVEKLQSRVLSAQTARRLVCRGEAVCGIAELPGFYALRQYQPAWITPEEGAFAPAEEWGKLEKMDTKVYDNR